MGDAPAAAVFCGEMCNGCKEDCAACATMACGDCGGCEHGRELSRRGRAAGAALALLQISSGVPLEFGFNPHQLRGPDGRFIKMGGRGTAGKGGLAKGSGLKNPRVDRAGRPIGSEGGGAGAGGSAPAVDAHGVTEGTRAAELRDAQADRIRVSKAGSVDTLERNAEVMYGSDHSKWPTKVRADLEAARRKEAAAAREEQAAANKRATEDARARVVARAAEAKAAAEAGPLVEDGRGPRPVGFTPNTDKDWNLTQKRLGKRTARTDPDGELQPGDIVPTKDGKWAEVLGPDTSKFYERNGLVGIKVRDDAKGYVHSEVAGDIKKRVEAYNAEKAWRDGGGSSDRLAGQATAPVDAQGLRPGEPPIGEDGKYAKPVTMYATHNGETYSRTTRNPYRYASVVSFRDPSHPDATRSHDRIWSWHRTAEAAQKGTLTGDQRKGLYVSKVVETGFEEPHTGPVIPVNAPPPTVAPQPPAARPAAAPQPTRQHLDSYSRQIEATARMVRDAVVDGEGPFTMDRYKERELSDRLQELGDARDAGNADRVDRVTAQIRKLLRDTDTQTEDELPRVPGQTGPTPKFTSSQAVDIIDGLFRQPVGEVLYEDDQTILTKENEDEDLRVVNKQTGQSRVIRAARVDAAEINTALEDLAKP